MWGIRKYAKEFPLASDYYKNQFAKILESRPNEGDFLYALKLCYEIDLERTLDKITSIQRILLQSEPPNEPAERLGIWLFLSEKGFDMYYSLHDLTKDAIDYTSEKKSKVMHNLCNRISEMLTEEDKDEDDSFSTYHYHMGYFIGSNIELVPRGKNKKILPDSILAFAKSNNAFFNGLGSGCIAHFASLNKNFQSAILELAYEYGDFAADIKDWGIFDLFPSLDESLKQKVLELAERNVSKKWISIS
jgi:hypothetical protein